MKTWRTKEIVLWRMKIMLQHPEYYTSAKVNDCFRVVVHSDLCELIHHYNKLEEENKKLKRQLWSRQK